MDAVTLLDEARRDGVKIEVRTVQEITSRTGANA
jgi:hypothetical protein